MIESYCLHFSKKYCTEKDKQEKEFDQKPNPKDCKLFIYPPSSHTIRLKPVIDI
jgi:hypothetical protein